MLFCGRIGMHVILRPSWSAKFILRPSWSAKFILRFDFLDITVRHEIGKRYIQINLINQSEA
ncbi:MAG: hypothetical protein DRR16_23395 [Candidatus Parabeggiatoa sp. nov. 3]|nr:MAG: hypothetical protein DRR00_13480 [Gammaproteobacteria bacterium]RKZ80728.1 MAG: hypothetical protein DRR16_23395 [Gammaproteobacteria bacterium]